MAGSLLFVVLLNGITFEKIKLPGIQVKELYIKWNEKLCIKADHIIISSNNANTGKTYALDDAKKLIAAVKLHHDWFESLKITSLTYNDVNASFQYDMHKKSYFKAISPKFELDAELNFLSDKYLSIIIKRFQAYEQNSSLSGEITYDDSAFTLYIRADALVAASAHLNIFAAIDHNAISVTLKGLEPIKKLKPIVDLFPLHKDAKPWIVDYTAGSRLSLHVLKAKYEYEHPEKLLESIYAKADYQDFVYTFQQGLEPIRTGYTDFVFEHGVLNILPRHATYCGQDTGSSWLNIDFNPKDEPVLTAYLDSPFILNNDILFLLDYFKISLPFKQLSGKTNANLTLRIPLLSVKIDAKGKFDIGKGVFLYKGVDLNITDSAIKIHNSRVDVIRFHAAYLDNLKVSAKGYLNFSTHNTDLHFNVEKVYIDDGGFRVGLDRKNRDLHIDYKLSSKEEILSFSPSAWDINGINVKLAKFTAPFDFEKFTAQIPSAELSIDNTISTKLSGDLDILNGIYDIEADISSLTYKSLSLNQKNLKVHILQQQGSTEISTDRQSIWLIDQTPTLISPCKIEMDHSVFSLQKSRFMLSDIIQTDINGIYDIKKKKGTFTLSDFTFDNNEMGSLFASDKNIKIKLLENNGTTTLDIEKLDMYFKFKKSGWKLDFYSLNPLSRGSDLMQEYNITRGTFSIESDTGHYPFKFRGHIDYPYDILVQKDTAGGRYSFYGIHDDKSTRFQINDKLDVTVDESIHIDSNNMGFNLPELIRYLGEHQKSGDKKSQEQQKPLFIEATNTYLALGSERRALADKLSLKYEGSSLLAQMTHKGGSARLKIDNEIFELHGKGFGEKFISNLFKSSYFKGGSLSFSASGSFDRFDGVAKIKNTTIRNYVLLNNLLAFINTIPALATFTVPRYSKSGFKVNELYTGFSYKNKILYIEGIKVDGVEMDIFGDGQIDYNSNTIDMDLSVKTQAGRNVGKIPLVGYILVGDDNTAMTSFKLSGDLDNPNVKNKMAKDIAVAPFNILIRTLHLPFKILLPKTGMDSKSESNEESGLNILNEHLMDNDTDGF